jgi:hypothetical protein
MATTPPDIHKMGEDLWMGSPIAKMLEPCVRTVAGRAYYAAYLSTREALRSAYGDPNYDVGHKPLWSFMIGSGVTDLKLPGNLLKALNLARERADYDLTDTPTHAAAEALVDDARDVISQQATIESAFRAIAARVPPRT